MIPMFYKSFIDSLIEKIRNNQSYWNKTSSKNQFKLILNKGMIVLSYRSDFSGGESINMDIYDENGQIVDSITGDKRVDYSDFSELSRLYNLVKRKKDESTKRKLDDLMAEISSSSNIGKKE